MCSVNLAIVSTNWILFFSHCPPYDLWSSCIVFGYRQLSLKPYLTQWDMKYYLSVSRLVPQMLSVWGLAWFLLFIALRLLAWVNLFLLLIWQLLCSSLLMLLTSFQLWVTPLHSSVLEPHLYLMNNSSIICLCISFKRNSFIIDMYHNYFILDTLQYLLRSSMQY